MAQNEVNIRFRITSDGSLKMIGQQAKSAAAATENLAGARNRYSRGEKGVSQATSNSTKSFSKMRDSITGSGGLVAAYATLAANVFALSAVFLTLRRAAEVDQLRKGLSELGTVSGIAMESLSRGLVEATGNALSLEEAMRATAQVTSAGLDPSTLKAFGKAAKNISIVLGRDVSDSFDRLTRGVTKLEPELLDELGLFVRVDEATQKYAASVGKAVSDLTNFERRLAFSNEALDQATNKFGDVGESVDVNAYAKLAAAVNDLSKNLLETVNVALVPFVELLSKNPTALFATIGVFGGRVIAGAVANFGSFEAAAEKSSMAAANLGVSAANTATRLNTTSVGMRNLSGALRTGTADSRLFAAGFDAVARSTAHYEGRLRSLTITHAAYGERIRANTTIYNQFLAAQVALTLASANESAQIALLQLQNGEYRETLISLRQAISEGAQAFLQSTTRIRENAVVSAVLSAGQRALAATTALLTGAFTGATGAIGRLTAAMLANQTVQRLLTFANGAAATSMLVLGTVARLAAGGVMFLGSAMLIALPLLSLLALAATMGKDALEWIASFFRSDEENKLVEDLKETDRLLEELSSSVVETSRYLEGQESRLTSLGDLYNSLSNILNTLSGEYVELSRNSAFQDPKKAEFLNKALQGNVFLQKQLAKEAKLEGVERITSLDQLKNAGKSLAESVELGELALENARQLAEAYDEVATAVRESKQAADEFINAITPRTSLDALSSAFAGIVNAIETAEEQAESSGETINTLLTESLTTNQQITLGIDPTIKTDLDNVKLKIVETEEAIEKASKAGDFGKMGELTLEHAKLLKQQKTLTALREQDTSTIRATAKETAKNIVGAQKVEQNRKISLSNSQLELSVEKERNQKTAESLKEQQRLRDGIQKTIKASAEAEKAIYDQILDAIPDTKANAQLRLFLQGKITELEFKAAEAKNKLLTDGEKLLEQAQLTLSNTKARIGVEKQILGFKELQLKSMQQENAAAQKNRDTILKTRAALQNREVTSEEKLKTAPGSGKDRTIEDTAKLTLLLDKAGQDAKAAALKAGATQAEATAIAETISKSAGTRLADEIEAEVKKQAIVEAKIALEYDLLEAQYGLLAAQIEVYKEQKVISQEAADNLLTTVGEMQEGLATQEQNALSASRSASTAAIVGMGGDALSSEARVEEERRIQVRDAMIQQGDRLMAQDRVMQGLQVKRNAFEAERQVLAQRVADLKAEQKEGEEPSQALMQAEAALQANLNTQLQIRAEQIAALIEKAKGLSGDSVPGLESITAQTANEIVPEVPGAESGMPTAGVSATGEDPSLTMQERVGQLRESAMQMTTVLGELGPEGEAMQQALNGAFTLADTFATAFDQINDGGMTMQEGLQAAGAVVAGLAAMQQAQGKQAVAAVDQQIAAEKKRDGKSKESLAKIAALEKKKEKIERKNFERNKRAQLAQAIISTAAGIAKAVSESPMTGGLPGSALAAVIGAAQIAVISGQTFQGGGGSAPSAPSKVSVGNRQNTVDLARAKSPSGELAYARGASGTGQGMTNYSPTGAFSGMKYRANGGNTAFMVGEQGPELFVPETPGTIMPSDETETMGAPLNVNFTVNAMDTIAMEDMLLNQRGNIIGMIREAANASGETFIESVNVMSDQYQVER